MSETAEAKPVSVSAAPAAANPRAKKPAPKDRSVLVHLGVFVVAAAAALTTWSRDKESKPMVAGDVTVWAGRPADIKKIAYESKSKKVVLEPRKDEKGDYYVGTSEHDAAPSPKAKADAGPPEKAGERQTTQLLSVGEGQKLVEALAPLKALRDLGKVEGDKLKDFGLDAPDGTITVDVAGTERKLVVGGATPGSSDRYVKDATTNEVYAIKGDLVRDLESADTRLVERDLHEWKDNDVQTAVVAAGGKSREVVRGGADTKRFWADKATRDTNDETFGNWMSKLQRLRPTAYVAEAPAKIETVLKIGFSAGRSIGFVELGKVAGEGQHHEYYLKTERTRLWAKVSPQDAEGVEQDLAGVMK